MEECGGEAFELGEKLTATFWLINEAMFHLCLMSNQPDYHVNLTTQNYNQRNFMSATC